MNTVILLISALLLTSCFNNKEKISVNENPEKDIILIGKTAELKTPDSSEKMTERKPEVSEINNQKKNFLKQFEKFKTVFNSKDISKLNEYINPEYGFFVLDNPGATVNAYQFNSFDSIFKNSRETDLYRLKNIEISCEPKRGKMPVYRCGDDGSSEGWDKVGCYYSDDFERNLATGIYYFVDEDGNSNIDDNGNYTEANYILQAKFNRNAEQSENVFYSTNFMIGLYFGEINGKFYLLMINLVTPCDA